MREIRKSGSVGGRPARQTFVASRGLSTRLGRAAAADWRPSHAPALARKVREARARPAQSRFDGAGGREDMVEDATRLRAASSTPWTTTPARVLGVVGCWAAPGGVMIGVPMCGVIAVVGAGSRRADRSAAAAGARRGGGSGRPRPKVKPPNRPTIGNDSRLGLRAACRGSPRPRIPRA